MKPLLKKMVYLVATMAMILLFPASIRAQQTPTRQNTAVISSGNKTQENTSSTGNSKSSETIRVNDVQQLKVAAGEEGDPTPIIVPVSIVTQTVTLALLALAPFLIMLLTSFIKIVIVLSLLRNAVGSQQTPPNQIINGVAIILTLYIMFPTGLLMYDASKEVIQNRPPNTLISTETAQFIIDVTNVAKEPLRVFLKKHTEPQHIQSFYQMAYRVLPEKYQDILQPENFVVVVPAYITSQIKNAFEISVLIYLPFFVIDLVTSNILLAMGMQMLSPMTISLPLKLLLLVMVDGWTLITQGLVLSYQ
ncbi:MAG: sctR [Chlamydiales bacterium]|jgi:type III secretion protein R|nr:sctR [Chlamydiales bacterium]